MAKWIVGVVLGLLCVVAGAVGQNEFTGEVSCGSETMSPGDICEETRNGVTETKTYDEMVAEEKAAERAWDAWGRWVVLGVGIVLLGGSITAIVVRKRKGPATPAQPGQPPVPAAPPGYPPVPPGQHQPPYQPGPATPYQQNPPQNWNAGYPPQQPGGFGPQGGQNFGPQGGGQDFGPRGGQGFGPQG